MKFGTILSYCEIELSISELHEHASSHCYILWYKGHRNVGMDSTPLKSSVHDLYEHTCPIAMYGLKLFAKGIMPILCASPNSPDQCWGILVSEFRKFNCKTKKNFKNGHFQFDTIVIDHFYLGFDGIVTMVSLVVQMDAL